MPRTTWLLAAAVLLPLLVPPSAVSHPPGLMATEISSAKVCGAAECREVSDPEAATALAAVRTRRQGGRRVFDFPRFTVPPERELPWYKSTLTITADPGGEVDRDSRLRHRGALRRADALGGRYLGDPAQREQGGLREAHSRAYAPPGEDASERGRGRAAGRPRRRGRRAPERGHPGERRLERLDRRAGRRRASGAHGGVAAQDPPPPRVDAASGARGTGVGTVGSAPDVRQGPGNSG